MKPYTKPEINRGNPKKWFVYFNYLVPEELKTVIEPRSGKLKYPGATHRFKVYKGINRYPLEEREEPANEIRKDLAYLLKFNLYNPFGPELEMLSMIKLEAEKKHSSRTDTPIKEAFVKFIQSRVERKLKEKTITSYSFSAGWLEKHLPANIKVGDIKHTDVSEAMSKASQENRWNATTINKEWEFAIIILNWLATEDYILKNPCSGKVIPLPTKKSIHKWYDRDTARLAKEAMIKHGERFLIQVCQFTYHILIRSSSELVNLKYGDIDMDLRIVRFRNEWTKNDSDQNREYPEEFHELLLAMKANEYPKDWYVFGAKGKPGPKQCGHNLFARHWKSIREGLGLSDKYTIYGWKHTRIVHEMMKGTDGYNISHMARHSETRTTDDHKRDYDITLNKVYSKEDLRF